LIRERHYLSHPDQVELLPGVIQGLSQIRALGLRLVVVTNQSGIGRGYFSPEVLEAVHDRLHSLLAKGGVELDGIYHCPHSPEEGCACRKPETQMLERAGKDLGFKPKDTVVVGDKPCDILLGKNVGAVTALVRSGYGARRSTMSQCEPDLIIDSIADLAQILSAAEGQPSGVLYQKGGAWS
jgi:histidinol-phosphate phosphatase family protein